MKKKIILTMIAWIIGLIWILPFVGLLMTATRPMSELMRGWWRFDSFTFTWKNFAGAWNHPTASLKNGVVNSLMVAVPATVIPLLIATMAGYGFSRYKFRFKKSLFVLVVITLALPQQTIAVPIFQMMNFLGLIDSYLGLVIVHTAWGIPWITFFMRNFFYTVPKEMEEAARIDGANDIQTFFRIILPIALPAIGSACALQFTWVWSDFFLALILVYSPNKLLATQRIPLMRGVYHVDWGLLASASIMVMIVPIIVYLLLQKYYIRGMIGWSLK
ncbi:carbohydrate ABC transporter permease [Pseudothermotoga thermarum]|uniref:Carbohydrate ABC transporter membrane protein 2, CUT1 family n=1 Tax=Pseudothermotoga thermarum DSM 5069 TaxID=688269 RepID=F7YW78_9THEM|nr:carbohydrate ABC transporter permease [Pseudothermotoga thermarum]AEH51850.1 carbohydrate ABC transporter membrane protein 2, CUT1 family [Pseudothermotoga thermarum DSM 5069]